MQARSVGRGPSPPVLWIGVDVGGTFTDAVVYERATETLRWSKAPSVPEDPARGVRDALASLLPGLEGVARFVHGVTIGTNAVIERNGADVWVVTSRGFRDTLEIARTERRVLYDIKTLKPAPLVPRTRVLEVDERLRHDGTVVRPLPAAECESLATRLAAAGARSVAVCFLHSFANDAHEQAMTRAIARALPHCFVCASSEVLPELREYERFSTTVLNAYIGPIMNRYLGALEASLAGDGFRRTVFLMTSSGGVTSAARARRFPVHTVLSGPAGGVAAAIELGRRIGLSNLITYDMGGTSTDVCLVEDLRAPLANEQLVAGYANRTPQMDIVTIGAGGGSIAWVDDGAILKVGPRSAGAAPGPAAYGLGGREATVTDANLVLNRLSPETALAERLRLDASLARGALARLAERLAGIGEAALADGVVRIAVARMVSAIKEISIAKGFDPRDFSLVAYGGAGPMHAALVAQELDVAHVVVPPSPGNFSAFGCLVSDLRQTLVRTHLAQTRREDWSAVAQVLAELEQQGRAGLLADGVDGDRIEFRRELGMRYVGQSWELTVGLDRHVDSMAALEVAFRAAHEKRYGHGADAAAEVVSVRVTAIGRVDKPTLARVPPAATGDGAPMVREVYFDGGYRATAVRGRDTVAPGVTLEGPLLVEEMGSLTVVPPGWTLMLGEVGEFHLRRRQR